MNNFQKVYNECVVCLLLIVVALGAGIAPASALADPYYEVPAVFLPKPKSTGNKPWKVPDFGPVGIGISLKPMKPGFQMVISKVDDGSPAAATGKLKKGQVIERINGQALKDLDPRIILGNLITEAEATDGRIMLRIKGVGDVLVQIPVMGAYSETWPVNCPKSDKIVRELADLLAKQEKPRWGSVLFMLSTGEEKDLDVVRRWMSENKTLGTYQWHIGYHGIGVCEYYLRTGDKTVLPMIAEAAQMLYTQEFISPWSKGDAEPTREELAAMAPVFEPFIMHRLIPGHIRNNIYIPAYRRKGVWARDIVHGEPSGKVKADIESSGLDELIAYYNTVGVDDFNWEPFGPEMRLAEWDYFTFTPSKPATAKDKTQYREAVMPEGMANWYAVDFDAKKAGWDTGQAPFGQSNGKKAPLMNNCRNPQCRCDVAPNTYWENDALFIRQTFEVPELKGGHRYRLVVGGGNHGWAGEGFVVYLNGKKFAQEENAKFKRGGTSGMYFFNDFLPELKSGKITVAVNSFLRRSGHRGKSAPPRGHLSVWLEEAKMPPLLVAEVQQREHAGGE